MENYSCFKVEVKKIQHNTPGGQQYPRTAILSFYNDVNELVSTVEKGYPSTEDIYDKIENGEAINLDDCYIKNFSITAYRKIKIIDKKEAVVLHDFSARNAFFDSNYIIDFSKALFKGEACDFENTHFLEGKVNFDHACFQVQQKVSFSQCFFREGNVSFANALFENGHVDFKNSVFNNGIKDFQYTKFGKGYIDFTNVLFHDGEVSFINTNFDEGDITFKAAVFGESKIDFRFAKFKKGEKNFERVEFGNGRKDFRAVEFNQGRLSFSRANFGNGDVIFEGIEVLEGRVNFKKANFGKGLLNFELAECKEARFIFDRTHFGEGNISFLNAKFNEISMKYCHFDHYLDLRVAKCESIDLSYTIVRDIIDIKPYDLEVIIESMKFTGMRLIGRLYIDWKENKVNALIKRQEDTSEREKAEQYRILKENFNVTGQYDDEDQAYIEFKRHEAKANLKEDKNKGWHYAILAYMNYGFRQLVFDHAGLYATSPLRVLFSMLVSYTFFSILFVLLSFSKSSAIVSSLGDPDKLSLVVKSFYHSIITFLTIGYGDYYPSGIIRWISGFEGFLGLFLMSYFTVAFVRKILR